MTGVQTCALPIYPLTLFGQRVRQGDGEKRLAYAALARRNADDATRRSVVAAVERIDALPYRGFEKVFKREIDFIFIYDGD